MMGTTGYIIFSLCSVCSYKPHWGDRFHYKSTSTYPTYNGKRDGDPIADHFSVILRNNCAFLCIADGCNWYVEFM